jgi:hypothetical protein
LLQINMHGYLTQPGEPDLLPHPLLRFTTASAILIPAARGDTAQWPDVFVRRQA